MATRSFLWRVIFLLPRKQTWKCGLPNQTNCWYDYNKAIQNLYSAVHKIDGVHERRNSIANALELCLSCTNPSKCPYGPHGFHYHIDGLVQEPINMDILYRALNTVLWYETNYPDCILPSPPFMSWFTDSMTIVILPTIQALLLRTSNSLLPWTDPLSAEVPHIWYISKF